MNADQILAVPLARPERLFTNPAELGKRHRELALAWHPDRNTDPRAAAVLAHVNVLHDRAKKAIAEGTFGQGHVLAIKTAKGDAFYPYLDARPFELGEVFICQRHVIYATERKHDDLVRQAVAVKKAITFADEKMKRGAQHTVPKTLGSVANADRTYTIINRPGDYVRLIDILDAKGPPEPRHAVWMISRMIDVACYLEWAKLRHLALNVESFYVEPESHKGSLLGGWFFAGSKAHPPIAAPAVVASANIDIRKAPSGQLHLAQVKRAGRTLLGARSYAELNALKHVPAPVRSWLSSAAGTNPVRELEVWRAALVEAFGKRAFVPYPLRISEVYKEK